MEELEKERNGILAEIRKLHEAIKTRSVKSEAAEKQLAELRAKKRDVEQRIALASAPRTPDAVCGADEIRKAMIERRAITLNGTGAVLQVQELQKALMAKTPLLERVRYFTGANAQTMIPIYDPPMATPASYAEGATAVVGDTQAALGAKSLIPYAYSTYIAVSAETLELGSVNFAAQLPGIFADAFAQGFHTQIAAGNGSGRNMLGLFAGTVPERQITSKNVGSVTVIDLVDLALSVKDYMDRAVIVMNQKIYSAVIAADVIPQYEIYKEEIIRSRRIEGVEILLTSAAPLSMSTGAIEAVAGDLQNYAVAMAGALSIKPIDKVGDTNTYYQAHIFANGCPIVAKNFWALKGK
jgi:HK97 family phage major capsid protein